MVTVFGAPPIPGLSVAGGFKLMVEDRGGLGLADLAAADRRPDRQAAKHDPGLTGVSTQFRSNTPQLFLDIDRTKVESLGVSLDDVNQTLQIYLGSLYVNSFNEFGRYWQVNVQAEGEFRNRVEDINLLQVRNKSGQMVPLGTLVDVREIGGPVFVTRYNLVHRRADHRQRAAGRQLRARPSRPSTRWPRETLPRSMKTEWTELMFMQIRAGNTAMYVFALAVVFVFLALAALYESWSLPLAVILVVPLCLLCSVAGVLFTHTAVNIFVQIGLVVLVGLACKNAILIVEFAKQLHQEGRPRFEATLEASPAAAAADPDDLVRLHPRRRPAGRRHGGRGRDAPVAGDRRVQRHARRDAVRHLPDAGLLLRHPGARRDAAVRGRDDPVGRLLPAGRVPGAGGRLPAGADRPCASALGLDRRGLRGCPRRAAGPRDSSGDRGRSRPLQARDPMHRAEADNHDFALLHRSADLRLGAVDRHRAGGRRGRVHAAGRAVPRRDAADGAGDGPLPGANAQTVRDTVAAPIEEQVSGVEDMMYMSSQCTNDGAYTLTVTFKLGMDSDMAQVLVQNRVSLALPVIPALVQSEGINVKKMSPNTMMIVNLISPDGRYDNTFLSNYATIHIKDELGRLPGVAGITYLGQRDYSLRAWLDPDKLAALEPERRRTWSPPSASRTCRSPPGRSASSPSPRASSSS